MTKDGKEAAGVQDAARLTGLEPSKIRFFEMQFADLFEAAGVHLTSPKYTTRRLDLLRHMGTMMTVHRLSVAEIRKALVRQIVEPRQKLMLVAVTSGKGGVGKTTVALNLAISLSRLGLRTLLFDADLGLANVHVYAGLNPRGTVVDVVSGHAKLEDVIQTGLANVHIVCGDSGVAKMADLSRRLTEYLATELQQLASSYDAILVDTAAGISTRVVEFLRIADEIVLVTTPNIAATLDAYSVVKIVRQNQLTAPVRVLINQTAGADEAAAVYQKISTCAARFLGSSPSYLGHLVRDPLVEQSHARRQPLVMIHPASANALLFRDIASTLYAPRAPAGRADPRHQPAMAEANTG